MRLVLAALLALAAGSARADPLPSWLEGVWIGRGIIMPSEALQQFDSSENEKALRAGRFMSIQIRTDIFTVSPLWPIDFIEGDGLAATSGSGPLRDDDPDINPPPYTTLGDGPTIEPERQLPFVVLSMGRCLIESDHYIPLSDDGHLSPAQVSSTCDTVKLFRLSEDVIAWPASFGWIVMQRSPPEPASAVRH